MKKQEDLRQKEQQNLAPLERKYQKLNIISFSSFVVFIIWFLLLNQLSDIFWVETIATPSLCLFLIWGVVYLFFLIPSKDKLASNIDMLRSIPTEYYTDVRLLQSCNALDEDLRKDITSVVIKREGQCIFVKYILNNEEHSLPQMNLDQAQEFVDFSSLRIS